jgi:hypothetical protein
VFFLLTATCFISILPANAFIYKPANSSSGKNMFAAIKPVPCFRVSFQNFCTMKPTLFYILFLSLFGSLSAAAQQSGADSTGLPGDNFSLQGALEMFRKSSGPEEFEKQINIENNNINNLDLNDDGEIDYIKVIDKSEGDAHAFILQVPVSESESQDIAVIELEKTGDTTAVIQIIGDEDIYGEEVIVEPDGGGNEDDAFMYYQGDAIAKGPNAGYYNNTRIIVNVWFWPSVRFVYGPVYRPWASPWRWRHYPGWYRPWRPMPWRVYHPLAYRYHRPFVIVHTHRMARAHRIYTPVRVTSVSVGRRHYASVNNYRVTRRTTTVTGPRGNKVTRHTTTVRGKHGGKVRKTRTVRR